MRDHEPITIKEWRSLPEEQETAVRRVVREWEGTPYVDLHRIKGMGVDCFQLVAAFLDDLHGSPPGTTKLPRHCATTARFRPDIAAPAIRNLVKSYEGCDIIRDGTIEPGDIVVSRSILEEDGHLYEGHAMIATAEEWSLLHAIRPRTCRTTCEDREIVTVYRSRGKHLWS